MKKCGTFAFCQLNFKVETNPSYPGLDSLSAEMHFDNGFGASVVRNRMSYGGESGLYELAVLKGNDLCYNSDITNDVVGFLTEGEVSALLVKIESLSPDGKLPV